MVKNPDNLPSRLSLENKLSSSLNPASFNGLTAAQGCQTLLLDCNPRTSGLVWFPQGIPAGKSVCVASSRLGRKPDEQDEWFDALRTLAVRLSPQTHFFVTSNGTTTDTYVRHLCRRFGFSAVELLPWTKDTSFRFAQHQTGSASQTDPEQPSCWAGSSSTDPRIVPAYCLTTQSAVNPESSIDSLLAVADLQGNPFDRDMALIRIAAECYLLSVRPRGKIHRAVMERIIDSGQLAPEVTRTWILLSKQSKNSSLHRELLKAGAVGWWLYSNPANPLDASAGATLILPTRPEPTAFAPPILNLDEFPAENFLIHWTRDRSGPWPQQTEDEWLDDLIFRSERRRHGAAYALRRILATRQILASRNLTRDERPVVCLSNRSLRELGELTLYRPHLGRWDFVPFGVAIDREWLANQGARPVIYGESESWESMSDADRPFFQISKSKSGQIDWTIEREWRWLGNLNLRQAPQQAVAVFVPTLADGHDLAAFCNWPIVVLGINDHPVPSH